MKDYFGQTVYFDELSFQQASDKWNKELIPAINAIGEHYNALGIGNFDEAVFHDLIQCGVANVTKTFQEALQSEFNKMGGPLVAGVLASESKVSEKMIPLGDAIKKFENLMEFAQHGTPLVLSFEEVSIGENGRAILNETKLTERYSVRLDTERKVQAHDYLLRIKELCADFRKFLDSVPDGKRLRVFGEGVSDFVMEDINGDFDVNFQLLGALATEG